MQLSELRSLGIGGTEVEVTASFRICKVDHVRVGLRD